jgi:hypothetical protein
VNAGHDDEPEAHLRALAGGLAKCGIPIQLRSDADRRPYLRASHPSIPMSTDVYCVRIEGGTWSIRSEWGSVIAPADDQVSAIGYIVRLLHIPPR